MQQIRRELLFMTICLATMACTSGGRRTLAPAAPAPEWKLAWSDEFDGNALDETVWTRCRRGRAAWSDTMSDDPRLLRVENGILHLRGIVNDRRDDDPADYLTTGITSKGNRECRYGKVQIRARFKSAQGAWPALWMVASQRDERTYPGEIDLMEHLNFDDFVYQTVHSEYTLRIDKTDSPPKSATTPIERDDWNTYGCEWNADRIVFTVNGRPTHTYPRVPDKGDDQWPFDKPFYFLLTMQIGGNWVNASGPTDPEHYPAWMEIDWVRLYEPATTSR